LTAIHLQAEMIKGVSSEIVTTGRNMCPPASIIF
jgi:hypothetical protein